MAVLRVRRVPNLPSLAVPRRTYVRAYSILRTSTEAPRKQLQALRNTPYTASSSLPQLRLFSTTLGKYDTVVKVPQMAESISEGTLSTFSKQVGDYVEQDEEIASIETDKIDVSVNAPEAGTLTELLVSEGDTVTVGQEIAKLEPGSGGGGGAKEAKSEAKEEKSSEPEPKKEEPKKEEPKKEAAKEEKPAQPKEEKPAPPKEEKKAPPPKPAEGKKESKGIESPFGKGSRNEDRVSNVRLQPRDTDKKRSK